MTDDLRETTPEAVRSIVGVRGAPAHRREAIGLGVAQSVIDATNAPSEAR